MLVGVCCLVVEDQVGIARADARGAIQRGGFQNEAPASPPLDGEPEPLKAERLRYQAVRVVRASGHRHRLLALRGAAEIRLAPDRWTRLHDDWSLFICIR